MALQHSQDFNSSFKKSLLTRLRVNIESMLGEHSGCWDKSLHCHRCSCLLPGERSAERKAIKRSRGRRSGFHDQTNPSLYSIKVCRAQTTVPDQTDSSQLRATGSTQGWTLHSNGLCLSQQPLGPAQPLRHLSSPTGSFQGLICKGDHQQQTSDLV